MSWLQANYIELTGAVTGLIFLYLEIRQNIWLWPVGFITSAFYVYIFFVSKFYADMGLQFYYLVVSVYGWWHWLYGGPSAKRDALPIARVNPKQAVVLLAITVLLFGIIAFILIRWTDSTVPYGDAFTTALSITATWMLARKILEHWWLWIIVNMVSLGLYMHKGLYPTSVLFFFYFAMSLTGYFQWKKSLILQKATVKQ